MWARKHFCPAKEYRLEILDERVRLQHRVVAHHRAARPKRRHHRDPLRRPQGPKRLVLDVAALEHDGAALLLR
ncbi:hypothetical protein DL768_008982 [Monosporascus sp. mg162]|nr:hypothetical protein DL768_008982 [Monosporascus sp. mg162]